MYKTNILDNWYFANPINQRGQASYAGAAYGIDRWVGTGGAQTVTIENGQIAFAHTGSGAGVNQYLENPAQYAGKTLTLSALAWVDSGSGYLAVRYNGSSTATVFLEFSNIEEGLIVKTFTVPMGVTSIFVGLGVLKAQTGVTARASGIKMELGTVQTLAHQENGAWVLNDPPPNYAQELAKCQRYYQVIVGFYAPGASEGDGLHLGINLPVPMRITPSFSQDQINAQIAGAGGNNYYGNVSLAFKWGSNTSLSLLMENPDTARFPVNYPVTARLDGNLRFSADL